MYPKLEEGSEATVTESHPKTIASAEKLKSFSNQFLERGCQLGFQAAEVKDWRSSSFWPKEPDWIMFDEVLYLLWTLKTWSSWQRKRTYVDKGDKTGTCEKSGLLELIWGHRFPNFCWCKHCSCSNGW